MKIFSSSFSKRGGWPRLRLDALSAGRWFREHVAFWLLIGAVHAVTATLVVDTVFRMVLHQEKSLGDVAWVCGGCVVASWAVGMVPGGWRAFSLPPRYLWAQNMLRRNSTWVAWGGVLILGTRESLRSVFFLFPVFLCLTRSALMQKQQRAYRLVLPASGARRLFADHLVWALVEATAIGAWFGFSFLIAAWGAAMGSVMMMYEGDSGVPFLNVWAQIGAGVFCGLLCAATPWALLGVAYAVQRMWTITSQRVLSREWTDEDTVF